MARYIDADELVNWLKRYNQCCNYSDWDKTLKARYSAVDYVIRQIEDEERFPTADVAEVKHGYWKEYFSAGAFHYDCSNCDYGFSTKERAEKVPNYCENCGAKMDGGEEDV